MRISVLGSGNIGGTLGKRWAAKGHEIVFGVRDPQASKVADLLADCQGVAKAAGVDEAVTGAEAVLVAIPGAVMEETAARIGNSLNGKIIIDATNNIRQPVQNSLEVLRQHAPDARLYRAFHNLGWENFAEPAFDGVPADLFFCGEPGETREMVEGLIADVGLRPVYVGGFDQAPIVDNLTRLWFALALERGLGRHLAFKMLRPVEASDG